VVKLTVLKAHQPDAGLSLRIPAWAHGIDIRVNGAPVKAGAPIPEPGTYALYQPRFFALPGMIQAGDRIDIRFETPITPIKTPYGTLLTRGPLVYCFESVDNPGLDLDDMCLDVDSLKIGKAEGLEGMTALVGRTAAGEPVTAVPYFAWANRGPSVMRVFTAGGQP
jgi:hypothetical protein